MLLGCGKAGTTALWVALREGGHVCKCSPKEVGYFGRNFDEGPGWYSGQFRCCGGGGQAQARATTATMDASPANFRYFERIRATCALDGGYWCARLKMIMILREPVARLLSMYNHKANFIRRGKKLQVSGFTADALGENGTVVSISQYAERVLEHEEGYGKDIPDKLEQFFQLFNRSQILILSYVEWKASPGQVLKGRVLPFLGLGGDGGGGGEGKGAAWVNTNDSPDKLRRVPCSLQSRLAATFEGNNGRLYRLLDENPGPPMERRPFPRFELGPCQEDDDDDARTGTR